MNKVEKRPVKSILKPGFWVFLGDSNEEAFQEGGDA